MTAKIALCVCVAMVFVGVAIMVRTKTVPSRDDDLARRIVRIRGLIDDNSANEVIAQLLFLQRVSNTEPVYLHIDSPGGEVSPGLAILDTMEMVSPPIHTRCDAEAGSLAFVILASGYRGGRVVSESAKLSFAMPSSSMGDSESQNAEARRFGGILIDKVVKATGAAEEDVRRMFIQATNVTGRQAIELGLVDRIERR